MIDMFTTGANNHAMAKTDSVQEIRDSARVVESAAESAQEAAQLVESNVTEGIQPDIRELRINVSELNEKSEIRLRRIYLALLA